MTAQSDYLAFLWISTNTTLFLIPCTMSEIINCCKLQTMYGQKKNFSTFSYKLVQISPIMILVHSGAFLSISSWFCELTELIFVMIPYISSTGCPPATQRIMGHVQVANAKDLVFLWRPFVQRETKETFCFT